MGLKNKWRSVSASLIGPGHQVDELPNQDAVKIFIEKDYTLAVVSDGLGSAPLSQIGSRAACETTNDAVKIWVNSESKLIQDLLRLIQALWLIKVRPLESKECSATLLFSLVLESNKVILGQLGDGAILHWNNEKLEHCLLDDKEGFGNETNALKEAGILNKWNLCEFELNGTQNTFILVTDGISEDIEVNNLGEFARITDAKLRRFKDSSQGRRWLLNEFKNWSTPHHRDDKTIAVLVQQR